MAVSGGWLRAVVLRRRVERPETAEDFGMQEEGKRGETMPPYLTTPGQKVRALMPGTPEYLYGSYAQDQATTKMWVSEVSLTSDVATLNVQVARGPIPAMGSLVTVRDTQTEGGEFNVTRAPLTAVSISIVGGQAVGTISYALSQTNVAATTDGGSAVVDTPEVPEAVAAGSSVPAFLAADRIAAGGALGAIVKFPVLPADAVVDLQWAIHDVDGEYVKGDTVATVANGELTVGNTQFAAVAPGFYRFHLSGVTAGSGTIVAKLLA